MMGGEFGRGERDEDEQDEPTDRFEGNARDEFAAYARHLREIWRRSES